MMLALVVFLVLVDGTAGIVCYRAGRSRGARLTVENAIEELGFEVIKIDDDGSITIRMQVPEGWHSRG
jgi:hypothetical protein